MGKLYEELRELALTDFEAFVRATGVDVRQAYICSQRRKGRSLGTIARTLKISKQAVGERSKKC
jgi:hypothetical protein